MAEPVRTHTCGALRAADMGSDATLMGWVHRVRDLGALIFIDLRDRYGVTQVLARDDEEMLARVKRLRPEDVVQVSGTIERRSEETYNPKIDTGEVEIAVRELTVLNQAKRTPFQIAEETPVSEDIRLKYRYLDLRRERMQRNMQLRHRVVMAARRSLDEDGFLDIETPVLARSTPEGARDYLVPSRVHPGEFYALPQSPQIFKQLLMVSGMDRYFQIARCFRDEDLRADRQPEFTQIDLEMSFATPDLIFSVVERLMQAIFAANGETVETPFRRMPYAEAIARFGSDKPDLRFAMEIADVSAVFVESQFRVFREMVAGGGVVRALVVPGAGAYSRSQVDKLVDEAIELGAKGMVWARRGPGGEVQSSILKAAGPDDLGRLLDTVEAGADDLVLVAAGSSAAASGLLGQFRLRLARRQGLVDESLRALSWIVDFPMFEWSETEGRHLSMHHPFTAPRDEDRERLSTDLGGVVAKAYDLVLNGSEIGGGSIRIHDQQLQREIFRLLQISDEEAHTRFGFFLEALEYGTPPHGGIALGVDRIVALLAGESSIREVMAFPKTATAADLMSGAPSAVSAHQLRTASLSVTIEPYVSEERDDAGTVTAARIPVPDEGAELLFGAYDANLKTFEDLFAVRIRTDGTALLAEGDAAGLAGLERAVTQIAALAAEGYKLGQEDVRRAGQLLLDDPGVRLRDYFVRATVKASNKRHVAPKSLNQRRYLEAIDQHDIVFGVGPAGTGKTYLAMAQAVAWLTAKKVNRIILARPAVEAGERLGFLPGDLQEKVNPYLRPLYDALHDMLDLERVDRLLDRGTIEIAPLAFMRGRTLNDAFVILDEAQNTTSEQMKMFLTRLGFGSKAVITGDITQIDLPTGRVSGLIDAIRIVGRVDGVAFTRFDDRDVVRHPLVQKIVQAYEASTVDETARAEAPSPQ